MILVFSFPVMLAVMTFIFSVPRLITLLVILELAGLSSLFFVLISTISIITPALFFVLFSFIVLGAVVGLILLVLVVTWVGTDYLSSSSQTFI